uniref:Uncharacterized protein n=1 Tax=Medicago truncatula TaxID=3880 RepID=I3T8W7_MEDTR|nr:unknown [Medicago truncatula]
MQQTACHQEQTSRLISLRQILEDQMRLLDLCPSHSQIKPSICKLSKSMILINLLHNPKLSLSIVRPMHLNKDLHIQRSQFHGSTGISILQRLIEILFMQKIIPATSLNVALFPIAGSASHSLILAIADSFESGDEK